MKKIKDKVTIILVVISGFFTTGTAQEADSTGLPGDHFSLDGALELFKNAESPEAFEKALNTENNYVNNLDLNNDGDIDYIRVIDHSEEEAHALVLQAIVAKEEFQDIAVIEIEKTGDTEAILQIIGDEDIYGEEMIMEPFEEEAGGKGPDSYEAVRLVVNVWLWPSVRYIFRPGYVLWVSPWRWLFYPRWWQPWRVRPFHWYIGVRPHHHIHYHPVHVHRVGRAHHVYAPRRTTSVTVHNHYQGRVTDYRTQRGIVNTKKTTVVEGPRGGKTVIQRNQTTAVKRNDAGAVRKVEKTETRVARKNPEGDKMAGERTTTRATTRKADGTKVKATRSTSGGVRKTSSGTTKAKKTTTRATRKSPRKH